MKRILLVDDDPTVLASLREKFTNPRAEWEFAAASSGDEAFDLVENGTIDAIVSGPSIASSTGTLLAQVKASRPSIVRLMLVTPEETELAQLNSDSAHHSLAKSSGAEAMRSTLARGLALQELLVSPKLLGLIDHMDHLPSMPSIYFELVEATKAPDATIESLGSIIAKDIGMTAKLLQTVNSAVFGLREKIASPGQAATFLGLDMLKSIVLSVGVYSQYDAKEMGGLSIEESWTHNMRVASYTRAILQSERASKNQIEEGFLAGMMHDAGQLVLARNRPDRFEAARVFAERDRGDRADVERRLFGASHAAVAAYLLGNWGLPANVVEAVLFHHTPTQCTEDTFQCLTAVHVANALADVDLDDDRAALDELDFGYLERLGLGNRLPRWIQACREARTEESR